MSDKKKTLIFGASYAGFMIYETIHKTHDIISFVDNNAEKQKLKYFNLPVISIGEISNIKFDKIILANSAKKELKKSLIHDHNVDEEKIEEGDIEKAANETYQKITEEQISTPLNIKFFINEKTHKLLDLKELRNCLNEKIICFEHEKESLSHLPKWQGELNAISAKRIKTPEINCYRFKNSIASPFFQGLIYNDCIILESIPYLDLNDGNYASGNVVNHSTKKAIIKARFDNSNKFDKAILLHCRGNNYYHLMLETLSQIEYIIKLPKEFSDYPIIISDNVLAYNAVNSFLNNHNVLHRVIPIENSWKFVKDLLYINSPNNLVPNLRNHLRWKAEYSFTRESSLNFIRKTGFDLAKTHKPANTYSKIFLARHVNALRTYNQDEIYAEFEPFGFTKVFMEDHDFSEQVNIISNSDFIAGPTGAAWTNLIFAKPQSKALCWMSKKYGDLSCFSNLAAFSQVNLTYIDVELERESNNNIDLYRCPYQLSKIEIRKWLSENLS